MRNNWLFFSKFDIDGGCQYIFSTEAQLSQFSHLLSQFSSVVDSSFYNSNQFVNSGSLALYEAFSCMSKLAGALFIWVSTRSSNSNIFQKLSRNSRGPNPKSSQSCTQTKHLTSHRKITGVLNFGLGSNTVNPLFFANLASSTLKRLWKGVEHNQAFPILSIAAALIPPFDNLSSPNALSNSIPLGSTDVHQSLTEDVYRGCNSLAISSLTWARDAIEPKTGIKFPTILDCPLGGEDNPHLTTEVLVGIGSRSMRVIRIKSLKVYAFGLYVHPDSICEKLGPKYATVPISELKNRSDFFEDLLREDIHMTVRLVVNCNGLKINTVRDAFEKSLRNRLHKMNPCTDYLCLKAFGSYFTQDIPLPVGTTIDFRQTADGQLITEIAGKLVGAVRSKDLCRAFFDMYMGDVPVSVQAKHDIAQNVAGIMRRC